MSNKPDTQVRFGPMAMIEIDGTRIKALREQQGLTQLYVATAVGVTTDTISRWENGRYPSIKKDNGCKLAETLGVPLEEIRQRQENSPEKTSTPVTPALAQEAQKNTDAPHHQSLSLKEQLQSWAKRQLWPLLLLIVSVVSILLLLSVKIFFITPSTTISAKRIAPPFTLAEQAVPIIIDITKSGDTPVTLILTEYLAPGTKVAQIIPPPSRVPKANVREIKWLGKIEKTSRYSFLLYPNKPVDTIPLNGTISFHGKSGTTILGQKQIHIGSFHWADTNQDNTIDDREIIAVYDRYGDIPGFGKELDKIEDIWLGAGYSWDQENKKLILRTSHSNQINTDNN